MAGPIRIAILGNAASGVAAINTTAAATTRLSTKFKAAAVAAAKFAAAGLALGAGLAAYGAVKFAQAAAEDQQQAVLMAKAFKNAAGATDEQIAATERWITAQGAALGITDDQLRPALSKLVVATGDVAKAQKLASLAMNVSVGRQKDLGTVSEALAKAQNGNLSGLTKLGINTKNAAGETKTLAQITADLASKYGGSAKAAANTFQGRLDRLKLVATEAGEALGYKVIPYLTQFAGFLLTTGIPALTKFASWVASTFGPPLRAAGAAIGTVVGKVAGFVQSLRSGESSPFLDNVRAFGEVLVTRVVPAVVAFGQAVAAKVGPILAQLGQIISTQVVPILQSMGAFFVGTVVPAVVQLAQKVGSNLAPVFNTVAQVVSTQLLPAVSKALVKFKEAQPTIEKVAVVVGKVIGKAVELATAILGKVLPPLIKFTAFIVGNVIGALVGLVSGIAKGVGAVIDFGRKVADAGGKVVDFAKTVGRKIGDVVGFVQDLPGKIKSALSNAPTLLLEAGKDIVRGLINGIKAMAKQAADAAVAVVKGALDKAKSLLKIGSPSKVWDREVGRMAVQGMIDGFLAMRQSAADGAGKVVDAATAKVKERISKLREQLAGVRSDFAGLVEPIASKFTSGLFDFDTASAFTSNLATVRGTLTGLVANFKKLLGEGLQPGFLYHLFQQGGPALINDLASLDKASAQAAGSLYGQVMQLADQLGGDVAGATKQGQQLEHQTKRIEKALDKVADAVKDSAREGARATVEGVRQGMNDRNNRAAAAAATGGWRVA